MEGNHNNNGLCTRHSNKARYCCNCLQIAKSNAVSDRDLEWENVLERLGIISRGKGTFNTIYEKLDGRGQTPPLHMETGK